MKLIDILVQELPKRGGWPEHATQARQDRDGEVCFEPVSVADDFYPGVMSSDSAKWMEEKNRGTSDSYVTREEYEVALAALQQPAWNGVGLPPVGSEFEFAHLLDGFSTWQWCKCTAIGNSGVLCVDKLGLEIYLNNNTNKFRPIRTQAERQRDEFTAACIGLDNSQDWSHSTAYFDGLYEAIAQGKIPGVKLID